MAQIFQMADRMEYIAACPECDGTEWYLNVDPQGNSIQYVTGYECVNCGYVAVINDTEEN
jgi:Zn ribbon nucleic-acid-binding protein